MLIDLSTLNDLKEIMQDDFDQLISTFISDGQTQIENLRLAVNCSDTKNIQRIAHALKGSSANLGIHALSESCQDLEHNAAENSSAQASELLDKIISHFEAVKKTLEENY